MTVNSTIRPGLDLAIIGMSGRFPGAANVAEFWQNLKDGVESIAFFSEEELKESGAAAGMIDESYIPAKGVLKDIDCFDASFFGYTPVEAEKLDPQIRLFHQTVWSALEDAGYNPESYPGLIALYGGATDNALWQLSIALDGIVSGMGLLASSQLSDKDHICSRISYKLNLRGPVFSLATQCSTSLVAFHLACQALLSGECDMALAGGVSVTLPQKSGHTYQEGMVYSSDGHCRAFDHRADGTVFGNGCAVVAVKRAEDALEADDHIYAVVRGTAVNNDGGQRVGYTAPGTDGQMEVIRSALIVAEVEPANIVYVETHGTGTTLGDPIEVQALSEAFDTEKKGYCAIGSVKSNVGHLDAAAGVTSLIKAVLVLTHRLIPPSLHVETPNKAARIEDTPFYVNNRLKPLDSSKGPLIASVSSFGIGGTNAHVVLQQAPYVERKTQSLNTMHGGHWLLPLSARTPEALNQASTNLSTFLQSYYSEQPVLHNDSVDPNQTAHPAPFRSDIFDIAYTLQTGRKSFSHRQMAVCSTIDEAARAFSLTDGTSQVRTCSIPDENNPPRVVFMFSGQGDQYIDMGLDLYKNEPVFRETMDRGFSILEKLLGPVKWIVYPGLETPPEGDMTGQPDDLIKGAVYSGPLKFIFDYAVAKLLISWGIRPWVMIGHSFGEYTAACLSGVFSMEDALKLVVLRGQLMDTLPPGTMLSVTAPEAEINRRLADNPQDFAEISIAAVNSPSLCIVAGPTQPVEQLAEQMTGDGYECIRIHFPKAGHSCMMDPILPEYEEAVRQITLNPPQIPYYSSVSGKLIDAAEAASPAYWARHMRYTVRFRDGICDLIQSVSSGQRLLFVQVGAGRGLSMFLGQYPEIDERHLVIDVLRNRKEEIADTRYLMERLGDMWLFGLVIDWNALYSDIPARPQRVSLPTYPFERHRFANFTGGLADIFKGKGGSVKEEKREDISSWFYAPCWLPSVWPKFDSSVLTEGDWLIFIGETGFGERLYDYLTAHLSRAGSEHRVIPVRMGNGFSKDKSGGFSIDPNDESQYKLLIEAVCQNGTKLSHILHLWGLNQTGLETEPLSLPTVQHQLQLGYYSLNYLTKYLEFPVNIGVVTTGVHVIDGFDSGVPQPGKAAVLSPVRIIPSEIPGVKCFAVDINGPVSGDDEEDVLMKRLLAEFNNVSHAFTSASGPVTAFRGSKRFIQNLCPAPLAKSITPSPLIKQQGVYVIIGGLGGVGLTLATHLACQAQIKLALVSRSGLPPDDKTSINACIEEIERSGSEVLVLKGDVAVAEQMQGIKKQILEKLGPVNGIIHSAMVVDGAVIGRRTPQWDEKVLAPKVTGTLVLDSVFDDQPLDFILLCSSIASYNNSIGETGYCAGNIFQDTYARLKQLQNQNRPVVISVNWDAWQDVGQTVRSVESLNKRYNQDFKYILAHGIRPHEGAEAMDRILGLEGEFSNIAVYTRDISALYRNNAENLAKRTTPDQRDAPKSIQTTAGIAGGTSGIRHKRPQLKAQYKEPSNDMERVLANIFSMFFGYDRVGILDDFFELGGDSLKATMLISRIHKELDVRIPLSFLFESPNIEAVARFIRERDVSKYQGMEPVEEREYYPVTPAQKRMLILNRVKTNDISDNTAAVMTVAGKLDRSRFEHAVRQLIARHETLRTSFHVSDEDARQVIHSQVEFNLEYYEGDIQPEELIRSFIRPFDLEQPPLVRVGLLKISHLKHLVFYDLHHIIRDGSSTSVFKNEFIALYQGKQLPPLRIQYKDYACWQHRLQMSGEIEKQKAYWLDHFSGDLPVLNLPTDFPRPPVQSFEGQQINFNLEESLSESLRRLAKDAGATLYMVLLAAYNVLLSRYSGQYDIIVGSPSEGRPHPDLEPLIGMFVNTLAMRNFPQPQLTFIEFLRAVKTNCLNAYENQDYQFDELVSVLGLKRDSSRSILFDTMFDVQYLEAWEMQAAAGNTVPEVQSGPPLDGPLDGLAFIPYHFEENITQFDIITHAYESNEYIAFKVRYSSKLFKPESMEKMVENFIEIIKQVTQDPEILLSNIRIATTLEQADSNIPETSFHF